tara:strand:+ start:5814 stop:7049 length:1236 start_codon:yes stop_codon:yes gene_type:complete
MKKLNLAFLSYRSSPLSGGQGIYLKNLTESLTKIGHKVTVFSGSPLPELNKSIRLIQIDTPGYYETFDFNERLRIFSSLPQKNHTELDDFFKTMSGAFSEPILFGKRLANNKEFQSLSGLFDIFHDNQSISKYPAFIHNKLITTVHHPIHIDRDLDLKFEQNFFSRLAIKRWYSFLRNHEKNLKQSRLIVTPSDCSKVDIEKFFKVSGKKIEVLWNGISKINFNISTKKEFNNRLVTIVSSDVPMKNLSNLIKGFAIAKKTKKELTLTIIGDLREKNKELIDQLSLTSSIKYKPKISNKEVIAELQKSDIGVLASLYEGFGFPLIEMISTGLPVIVSNKGSLPELMGDAGLAFNPEDIADLAKKIIQICDDESLRENFVSLSIKRRDDFFDWDEYAMKLTKLYQKVINGYI